MGLREGGVRDVFLGRVCCIQRVREETRSGELVWALISSKRPKKGPDGLEGEGEEAPIG